MPAGVDIAEIRCGRGHAAQQRVASEAGVVVEGDRLALPWVVASAGSRHRGGGFALGLAGQARHQRDAGLRSFRTKTGRERLQITKSASLATPSRVRQRCQVVEKGGFSRSCRETPGRGASFDGTVAVQEPPEPPRLWAGALDPAVGRLRAGSAQAGLNFLMDQNHRPDWGYRNPFGGLQGMTYG